MSVDYLHSFIIYCIFLTHLHSLSVRCESVEQEAEDAQVSAVQHQFLRSELQRGVRGHQFGSGRSHWNRKYTGT